METHDLWSEILQAGGPKRIAQAFGRNLSTVYRWARNPLSDDDPDGTGSTNPLDWMEAMVSVLAARPEARPTLIKVAVFMRGTIDRSLDRYEGVAESDEGVRDLGIVALRETADVIEAANGRALDDERVLDEVTQAQAVLDRLARAMEARIEAKSQKNVRRAG